LLTLIWKGSRYDPVRFVCLEGHLRFRIKTENDVRLLQS